MTNLDRAAPDADTDRRSDSLVGPCSMANDKGTRAEPLQPRPQETLAGSPPPAAAGMADVAIVERLISENGRMVRLYIMKPAQVEGTPGVLFFVNGAARPGGDFRNDQSLLRDLVVGSGRVGVFVERAALTAREAAAWLEDCYAALTWTSRHAREFGADPSRIAVAENSLSGEMTGALSLMARDRNGPEICGQVLFVLTAGASIDATGLFGSLCDKSRPGSPEGD